MISATPFHGKTVLVFGLARSGLKAVEGLVAGGAMVLAADDRPEALKLAAGLGAKPVDWRKQDFKGLAAVVLSPGVPLTHPKPHGVVDKARKAKVEIIGDTEVFARTLQAHTLAPQIIGITGTNGKSTTTSLLGHVLARCGRDAQVGGNIGTGVMGLRPPKANTSYVLELSSYQLDLMHQHKLSAAVLLNITPDHLDRHGRMEHYVAAKARIFRNQGPGDLAVIGVDDAYGQEICTDLVAQNGRTIVPVSVKRVLNRGVYVVNGMLYDAMAGRPERVVDLRSAPALLGAHNWQNAAVAYAVARGLGHASRTIAKALLSFQGLAHRMEVLPEIEGVRFVNDSKATNLDAARQALSALDPIFWIAGGQAKGDDFTEIADILPRVRTAYLIGRDGAKIAEAIKAHTQVQVLETMAEAVRAAFADAKAAIAPLSSAPTVLLSPACASFDQYRDFEHRGDDFRAQVAALTNSQTEVAQG